MAPINVSIHLSGKSGATVHATLDNLRNSIYETTRFRYCIVLRFLLSLMFLHLHYTFIDYFLSTFPTFLYCLLASFLFSGQLLFFWGSLSSVCTVILLRILHAVSTNKSIDR